MARAFSVGAVILLLTVALFADTIYQTGPEGRQILVQQDAVVTHQDDNVIIYKHFDLHDHRVERVRLNQGSLPYSVVSSGPAALARIVDLWKRFGYAATVTDAAGKSTQVFDAYIDYYPPHGQAFLLQIIPPTTSLPIQLAGGGADMVSFSDISSIDFQGASIRLTMRDGRTEQGTYLMPAAEPTEARFLGITARYEPKSEQVFDFSIPISRIRQIKFQ